MLLFLLSYRSKKSDGLTFALVAFIFWSWFFDDCRTRYVIIRIGHWRISPRRISSRRVGTRRICYRICPRVCPRWICPRVGSRRVRPMPTREYISFSFPSCHRRCYNTGLPTFPDQAHNEHNEQDKPNNSANNPANHRSQCSLVYAGWRIISGGARVAGVVPVGWAVAAGGTRGWALAPRVIAVVVPALVGIGGRGGVVGTAAVVITAAWWAALCVAVGIVVIPIYLLYIVLWHETRI